MSKPLIEFLRPWFHLSEISIPLPVLRGPARGLWFRTSEETLEASPVSYGRRKTEVLADLCRPGYSVWECSRYGGFTTILFSRFVGNTGWVTAFEPSREEFMKTYDNVTLNGCANVFFLFAKIGQPSERYAFPPPIRAKALSIDEATRDTNLPTPNLIHIDLESDATSVLMNAEETVRKHKPVFVIERYDARTKEFVWNFFAERGYRFFCLDTGKKLSDLSEMTPSVYAEPTVE